MLHHNNCNPAPTLIQSLVERTPHNPDWSGHNPIHDPLENYTNAIMPKVQDIHQTTPFQYIHLNLISAWENLAGEKLLIIPFSNAAQEPKLHNALKNRILYVVTEITNSQGMGVSAPSPNADTAKAKHYPLSFLVYNLTTPQKIQLLERGVWSSQAITFQAIPFFPANSDYLFSIKGFSLIMEDHIQVLVHNIWHDLETINFAHNLVNTTPKQECATLTITISSFLDSLSVKCLNIKEHRGALTPCYNIFTNSNSIPTHKG